MCQAGPAKPFRFLYMSGAGAERDQSKKPKVMPEYSLLRVSYHSIHSDLIEIEIAFHLKTYDKTGLTNVQKKKYSRARPKQKSWRMQRSTTG